MFLFRKKDFIVLLTLTEKMVDGYFSSIPRSKPNIHQVNNTLLIAHRGAHNNASGVFENTQRAFQRAKESGCWGIELDVHATADGILVVNHDHTLKRLWHYDKTIADLSFKELNQLAPQVPSLAEIVSEYGNSMHLFIELKAPFLHEEALIETLSPLAPVIDYHLLTLDSSIFAALRQFPKEVLLLVAAHNNVKEFCNLSIKKHYGGVMGNYLLLTNKQRNKLKAANQVSGVGFVNSKNSLYRELNRGVQWIFTNEAVKVSGYLNCLREQSMTST
jgi:glycerophosphoryl diester phosphodiesterase